ncbi:MAG: hypothetical protein R6X02_08275 [Enhygromyxa sp.]
MATLLDLQNRLAGRTVGSPGPLTSDADVERLKNSIAAAAAAIADKGQPDMDQLRKLLGVQAKLAAVSATRAGVVAHDAPKAGASALMLEQLRGLRMQLEAAAASAAPTPMVSPLGYPPTGYAAPYDPYLRRLVDELGARLGGTPDTLLAAKVAPHAAALREAAAKAASLEMAAKASSLEMAAKTPTAVDALLRDAAAKAAMADVAAKADPTRDAVLREALTVLESVVGKSSEGLLRRLQRVDEELRALKQDLEGGDRADAEAKQLAKQLDETSRGIAAFVKASAERPITRPPEDA